MYADYHEAEIKLRDRALDVLAEKLVDAKMKLIDAETLLEIAVGQACDTTNQMWLNEVSQWLADFRKK